jgi:hypothetical protein
MFLDAVLKQANDILKTLNLKKNVPEEDDIDKNSDNDSDSEEEKNGVPQQIKRENNFFMDKVLEDVNKILKNFKKPTEKQEVHVQLKEDNNNFMKDILNNVDNMLKKINFKKPTEKQEVNENNNNNKNLHKIFEAVNNNKNSDEKYVYDDIIFSEKTIIGNEINDSKHEIYNFNKSTGMMEKRESAQK